MLVETLVYAASLAGTPRWARPHLGESVGLWSRGRRRRRDWAAHVVHAKGVICATIDSIPSRRCVVVLGSGPLFDVPVEALADRFETVILVDRVHLATVRRRVRSFGNIALQWRDLSAATNAGHLDFLASVADLDWVISANLASQLGHGAPEGRERGAIDAHLDGLAALACPVTVVTDLDYKVFGRAGRLEERFDLMHGRQMPASSHRWAWEVAPFGEESPHRRRVHAVVAYPDWRLANATTASAGK